ncbi:hypothetical protein J0X19_08525 [Hymenobacter sp. BT186]|uniref:Uncharacterized protein n=1 Tax=Hymenobacter telluris TaxID=2816474 RepID=A0A939JAD6_9BACT|nr:hypothetical protein [Hymenobacter telluris]
MATTLIIILIVVLNNDEKDRAAKSAYISTFFTHPQSKGTWLAEDGDSKLCGKLELLITKDSTYYGDRVFGDGHHESYYRIKADSIHTEGHYGLGASMQVRNDSLFLIYPKRQYNWSWFIEEANADRFTLRGDSYTMTFVKVADDKIAGHL